MNVEAVRMLDYYVGVPLCFLGTLVKKIAGIFKGKRQVNKPANILFVELSEMGSVILADPAMSKAKKLLDAKLFFAIFRSNSHSLELLNTIPQDNVFIMADASIFHVAVDAFRFLLWARKKRIDTVVDLELFSRFTALLTGFSGAGNRVGFHAFYNEGLYRGDFLTHKVAYNPHQHIAKNFIALVNALLAGKMELPYSKTVIPDSELSLRKAVIGGDARQEMMGKVATLYPSYDAGRHRLVIFNCNSSDMIPLRRWPQEYYIELARKIVGSYPEVVILLTGSEVERTSKNAIAKAVNSLRCLNFAGATELTDLPVLYSICDFMLTNDSGPAHFASVTDMPVYVFFGPETPKIYGPLGRMTPIYAALACSPCVAATNHRKSVCNDNVCLQIITPDNVYAMLRSELDRSPHPIDIDAQQ
jgi:ADP-heptose:LPS heptosyltransferase